MTTKPLTKDELFRNLATRKGLVAWLANVIFCHHTSPTRRLRNLAAVADRVVAGDFEGITFNAGGATRRLTWAEFQRATAAELA